jgi:DNA mismatch repair ATPase MutS
MVTLSSIADKISGIRFMIDNLDVRSALGKKHLQTTAFCTDTEKLAKDADSIYDITVLLDKEDFKHRFSHIRNRFEQLRDIERSLQHLAKAGVPDDIELYEIKHFCLLVSEIRDLLGEQTFNDLQLPDLEDAINILDPENQRIPHFYIYPSYHPELSALRKKLSSIDNADKDAFAILYGRCAEIEDKIRVELSHQLIEYADKMLEALHNTARLDILFAKALQAKSLLLCKPVVAHEITTYKGLFNPQVKAILAANHKQFQAVDIDLHPGPCVVTGANMAGKTVLLRTIALAQYLFQFGFFIPATEAHIVPVELVMNSVGDQQSELQGLSSFASEMLNINGILKAAKSNKQILALIDEPARTTNPAEGLAIANAVIDELAGHKVRSVITTHYSGITGGVRKLKVVGLKTELLPETISPENINDFIDYSLTENTEGTVPAEAIRIATLLGIDEELLEKAKCYISRKT